MLPISPSHFAAIAPSLRFSGIDINIDPHEINVTLTEAKHKQAARDYFARIHPGDEEKLDQLTSKFAGPGEVLINGAYLGDSDIVRELSEGLEDEAKGQKLEPQLNVLLRQAIGRLNIKGADSKAKMLFNKNRANICYTIKKAHERKESTYVHSGAKALTLTSDPFLEVEGLPVHC